MVNYAPLTLDEALSVRSSMEVVPYAGGTDLMVENRKDVTYLFLNRIDELKQIREDDRYIRIGAGVTFTQALGCELVPQIMKDALAKIAAPAIRNAGTFGGNLGNGSAKADSVLIEYAMDAKIVLRSKDGERIVDVDRFYRGNRDIDLNKDELITEILLPKDPIGTYRYQKVGGRNALAISRISFAGICKTDGEKVTNFAVAFGAVSATVLRFKEIEARLIGKTVKECAAMKEEILKQYSDAMVLTRGRVSAEYRKAVCTNLLRDFLDSVF